MDLAYNRIAVTVYMLCIENQEISIVVGQEFKRNISIDNRLNVINFHTKYFRINKKNYYNM